MWPMSCVTMLSMTTHFYSIAVTVASTLWMNPLVLVGLIAVTLAIVTGLAGRLVILCEDLRYTRFFSRNR
jgi:hypothetical protein